jgi:hypothetical protein
MTLKKRRKRGKSKAELSAACRELYFERFGDGEIAPCQWCGGWMDRANCHVHHKFRRWKNLNEPIHVVAVHGVCHAFIHAHRERENFLASTVCDGIGCGQGGSVADKLNGIGGHHRMGPE